MYLVYLWNDPPNIGLTNYNSKPHKKGIIADSRIFIP